MFTNSHHSFQNSLAVETGLSDFHKKTITVLKTCFKKRKLKKNSYRDYKNQFNIFRQLIFDEFAKLQVCNEFPALQIYLDICVRAHDKCAPKKSKYVTPNNSPFMNKKISKAIMDATRPRNKFLKNRSPKNKFA